MYRTLLFRRRNGDIPFLWNIYSCWLHCRLMQLNWTKYSWNIYICIWKWYQIILMAMSYGLSLMSVKSNVKRGLTGLSIDNYTLLTPLPSPHTHNIGGRGYHDKNHFVLLSVQFCLFPIFLIEEHWNFLLHSKIVYDQMVCHDFVLRSFGQVQSH